MKGLKTGGRTKGTPNRQSLAVKETLELLQFDPIEELIKTLKRGTMPDEDRAYALLKLMEFVYPKRKASEDKDQAPLDVTPDFLRLIPK